MEAATTAATMTPTDVFNLLTDYRLNARTVTGGLADKGKPAQVTFAAIDAGTLTGSGKITMAQLGHPAGLPAETMPEPEWESRLLTAAAVVWAASAGNPKARSGPGKLNRGLFGLDPARWQQVNADDADDPTTAARIVFVATDRFGDWSKFYGSAGLDPNSDAYQTVQAARQQMATHVVDDTFSWLPDIVPDWMESLGKLLANLVSPDWWRRVGVGFLGAALVIASLVTVFAVANFDRARVKVHTA